MRFRVASVQESGLPQSLTDARLWIEDWLNRVLGDADFGWPGGSIMLVMFAMSWPKGPPLSRLTMETGDGPTLALHLVIDPESISATPTASHRELLCREVVHHLPAKPLRTPKGLDYPRLHRAILSSLEPFASVAI